jgi:hypothetical protein
MPTRERTSARSCKQPKAVQSNPAKSRRRHHGLQLVALLTSLLKELKGPLKECSPNRVNAVLTPHDSAITATESNAFAMLMHEGASERGCPEH